MATDDEIKRLWKNFPDKTGETDAIVHLYRLAENEGKQAGISAIEKELLSDSTIEAAMRTFGWGKNKKASIIASRALMRTAIDVAKKKIGDR
ncbi:MAG: hypothetical protein ABIF01_05855 [Candidatus Micrarchaeota archaeon]